MTFDDDRPKPPPSVRPGENLADLSLDELRTRIGIYRGEIGRLEREIEAKEKSRSAAESVFRPRASRESGKSARLLLCLRGINL